MIGIVVVSHSRALADAAVRLAGGMLEAGSRPQIAIAAGLDEATLGTDAAAVADAIVEVGGDAGVLVLLDLGSAVLSAEMALELVEPDLAARVVVSSAPLVEGLVAAVVTASSGASIEEVVAEAERGLAAKQSHLGAAADADPEPADPAGAAGGGAEAVTATVVVDNEHGLHARPAATLVGLVRAYDATTTLTNLDSGVGPVNAASLSRVTTLNARTGSRLLVSATGPAADAVVHAVQDLAQRGFEPSHPAPASDDTTAADPSTPNFEVTPKAPPTGGSGLDLAIGPVMLLDEEVDVSGYVPGDVDRERARSERAVDAVRAGLEQLRARAAAEIGTAQAAIFTAHEALLDDPEVLGLVHHDVDAGGSAVAAWSKRLAGVAAELDGLDDPYQRERAQDVRSVLRRLLRSLTGAGDDLQPAGILVVPELDAATATGLDADQVQGVITLRGGSTGHGVLVARTRGIPVLTGVPAAAEVAAGKVVAFDARSGEYVVGPDQTTRDRYAHVASERRSRHAADLRTAAEPAITPDGVRIPVLANVASLDDAVTAAASGADGSGLVRTEVVFAAWTDAPSLEEQRDVYLAMGAALRGRRLTIRTWDVGGDKPLAFLPLPHEDNPVLGRRGLRVFREAPQLLQTQLSAVCLAAAQTPVRVMFPMVTTPEEVAWAREQLAAAARRTLGELPERLEVGIMVEVPSAALRAADVARGLDFVSVGTNDLTQYVTATDRGNGAVAGLSDSLSPAVLQLIGYVAETLPERTELAVCGDLASEPDAAALLVGLGARELSVVAPRVPAVKARLRENSLPELQELAAAALRCPSADQVRALLRRQR